MKKQVLLTLNYRALLLTPQTAGVIMGLIADSPLVESKYSHIDGKTHVYPGSAIPGFEFIDIEVIHDSEEAYKAWEESKREPAPEPKPVGDDGLPF